MGVAFFTLLMASGAGAYLGGQTYNLTGSYSPIFFAGAIAGLLGSASAFTISDNRTLSTERLGAAVGNA
jgi:predicted MFS family arabinose efflux permease